VPAVDDPPRAGATRRLGVGAAIVLVIAALAITVGIGILRAGAAPTESVTIVDDGGTSVDSTGTEVFVHVSGAVRAPGLYVLRKGARVVDAIAAAGGFADDPAHEAVNLAREIGDGEQLVVPTTAQAAVQPEAASPQGDGRIDLNTADEAALDTLPRVGPAMAQRIIEWRETNGRFTSVDDLLAVPGIGDKMLEALRELVTV
jgi:competence protein ComEA